MTVAIAERPVDTPQVSDEQLALIKRTVAKDATADELKLYLFDCARQGVHPLDKLVHFTKRAGKYTPITSIDFMRIRAAETNEYAGSDDAVFEAKAVVERNEPILISASVTVWRLVQGQRCSFTATARWSEYKPDQNDFMWKKMPHTMLAKCAEALALRKGFPRQLAGLYAKEEMDQADNPRGGYVVEAPKTDRVAELVDARATSRRPAVTDGGSTVPDFAGSSPAPVTTSDEGPDHGVDIPAGTVLIEKVVISNTKNPNVKQHMLYVRGGDDWPASQTSVQTINPNLAAVAEECCQERRPVFLTTKQTRWGWDLVTLTKAPTPAELAASKFSYDPPLTDKDISF